MKNEAGSAVQKLSIAGVSLGECAEMSPAMVTHLLADEMAEDGFAYFFAANRGSIKIGYTSNLKARARDLYKQTGVPGKMLAWRTGGRWRERAYLEQFRAHRLHGEWFKRHPDILAEIDRLNSERN